MEELSLKNICFKKNSIVSKKFSCFLGILDFTIHFFLTEILFKLNNTRLHIFIKISIFDVVKIILSNLI